MTFVQARGLRLLPCAPLARVSAPASTHACNIFTASRAGGAGGDGGRWEPVREAHPQSSLGATIRATPKPPFSAGGSWQGPFPPQHHPSSFPSLSFSEKLCVSTGVAGVFAPRDCACAPAWEEKCRLGENQSGAGTLASGAGGSRWEGSGGRGPGGWHGGRACACLAQGAPPPLCPGTRPP